MPKTAIALLFCAALLVGCGTPAMPVIQAAGVAKTAYDYSDIVMPRSRVDFIGVSAEDRHIEYAVRQRLDAQHVRYVSLAPFAIDGHLFLVGIFRDQREAERARLNARQIPGVRRLTCSFFRPIKTGQRDMEADRDLAKRIVEQLETDESLDSALVRISVQQQNAVVMGHVTNREQKQRLEALVKQVDGLQEMRSYLAIRS